MNLKKLCFIWKFHQYGPGRTRQIFVYFAKKFVMISVIEVRPVIFFMTSTIGQNVHLVVSHFNSSTRHGVLSCVASTRHLVMSTRHRSVSV